MRKFSVALNKSTPYLFGRFFDGISSGLFMMALPWLLLAQGGMGTFVALLSLACTLTSFLLTPWYSAFIDRHSRKAILVNIQVLQAATAGVLALFYLYGMHSDAILAITYVVYWVSSNMAWSTNNAFTQENYNQSEYAKISSYQEVVLQVTTLGSGALGVILLESWGVFQFSLLAFICASIGTISYILTPYTQKLRPEKQKQPLTKQLSESKQLIVSNPEVYLFILLSCLAYPVLTYLSKLVPIWFSQLAVSGSWFASYNIAFGLGSLVTGLIVVKLLNRFSHTQLMQNSMMILAALLFAMGIFSQPQMIVALIFVFGIFNALNRISRTNWMHHIVPLEQRGRIDGIIAMFSSMMQSLSYVLIAFLSHQDHIHSGFMIVSIVMVIASTSMMLLSKKMSFSGPIAVQ
ncbi:MFS transporter [Vibrio sp. S4M6]|uniref:MFS transporter n=1 Tax=Vibrio sinus TaxID=2946865 RepID=UPI00202A3C32|nr:MFS transporter [Vibrio sinus]MCL9781942.1 MFS transporter [Vibrio sinus]